MTYRMRKVFLLSIGTILSMSLAFVMAVKLQFNQEVVEEKAGYTRVTLNEMKHLIRDIKVTDDNRDTIEQLQTIMNQDIRSPLTESMDIGKYRNRMMIYIIGIGVTTLIFLLLIYRYIYRHILKPFKKLEDFAGLIAEGRYDMSLYMERKNIFGAFTKAFDIMRHELKMAREREEAATETKKTLIATLSHDIKTPVASIRAYAEGLSGGMQITEERRDKYLGVIMKKADEITKLTDDLFLHTISDMDKLAFDTKKYDAREVLEEILIPLYIQYDEILKVRDVLPEVAIMTDKARLAQVFNNILSNAEKYASDSHIEIHIEVKEDYLECIFQDHGDGVLPEDIPFLFDKFYRGKNTDITQKSGTGLGLYIVKYIMEKTHGYVTCKNRDGFQITIGIKRI